MRIRGGSEKDTLDSLRVKKFKEKSVTGTSAVKIQSLPPTSDAAQYHSLRVYYQVTLWRGKDSNQLNPHDWGWVEEGGRLYPKTMNKATAPEHLIKVIRCKCNGDCDNRRCTCRRYGF